jgi:hypothetical protein
VKTVMTHAVLVQSIEVWLLAERGSAVGLLAEYKLLVRRNLNISKHFFYAKE